MTIMDFLNLNTITDKLVAPFKLLKRDTTDKIVLIIEISFIFLLSFSSVYLLDLVLDKMGIYQSMEKRVFVGALEYSLKLAFRAIFLFMGLLFGASLFFGLWMRKTRERWTWKDFGFKKEQPSRAVYQGIFLGLIAVGLYIVI